MGTNEGEMLYLRVSDQNFEQTLMREYHARHSAMGRTVAPVQAIADA